MLNPTLFAAAALALGSFGVASAQTTLYATDFTVLDGWTVDSGCAPGYDWAADASPATPDGSFVSAPHSLNFNNGVDVGGPNAHEWGGAAVSCGNAYSPVIDLGAAHGNVELRFWAKASMEGGCAWDRLSLVVRSVLSGEEMYRSCLDESHGLTYTWQSMSLPMEASWGEVQVIFEFHVLDDWFNEGAGPFIDDLEVVDDCGGSWATHCDGAPRVGSQAGASLTVAGSLSAAANTLRFDGANFHPNAFATLFGAPSAAVLPAGAGVRCVGTNPSYRLGLSPTRDAGAPRWTLDLLADPLAGSVLPGTTWYFQTIFRDGNSFNFSDAVRVTLCQ